MNHAQVVKTVNYNYANGIDFTLHQWAEDVPLALSLGERIRNKRHRRRMVKRFKRLEITTCLQARFKITYP